jgi:hypothetical protein
MVGKVATFMVCGRFLLESAKDRFLGVDPLGQHIPPHVWYGMTCLLIRELWVCVLFESNGEGYGYIWDPPSARGARDGETLAECNIDPKEHLQSHVVISWPHTKGSVIVLGRHGSMEVF